MQRSIEVIAGTLAGVFAGLASLALYAGDSRTGAILAGVAALGILGGLMATKEESVPAPDPVDRLLDQDRGEG